MAMTLDAIYNNQKQVKRLVERGYVTRHGNGCWREIATCIV